jgi:hypothetical protein
MTVNLFKSFRVKPIVSILVLVMIVGLILRFYNFPYRYGLGDETIRDAIISTYGSAEKQLPLTGPFSSAGAFTFGPWYYYFLILFSILIPGAYAPWIGLSIFSAITIYFIYKIGMELEDKWLGIILATMYAVSPAEILAGTHLTNPNLLSLFSVLSVYLFILIAKNKVKKKIFFLFGLVIGVAINIHYQAISLLLLPAIGVIEYLFINRKALKLFLLTLSGLVVAFIPLLTFDLLNHWYTFKNITYYYLYGKNSIYVPNRWLFYIRDFWPSFWSDTLGVPIILTFILGAVGGFFILYKFKKQQIKLPLILLIVAFLIYFIAFRYYWGERYFGYFIFLRSFIFLFSAYGIYAIFFCIKSRKGSAIFLSLLLTLFGFYVIFSHLSLFKRDDFSRIKNEEVQILKSLYPNEKFSIYVCPSSSNTYYTSSSKTYLFLLKKNSIYSETGRKLGMYADYCLNPAFPVPKETLTQGEKMLDSLTCQYCFKPVDLIKGTGFVDLSAFPDERLHETHWSQITYKLIYDSVVKWWYDEKP